MTVIGFGLIVYSYRRTPRECVARKNTTSPAGDERAGWHLRGLFAALLLIPLVIPSDWTQDVPRRYGKRHPGMTHSLLYPPIEAPADLD